MEENQKINVEGAKYREKIDTLEKELRSYKQRNDTEESVARARVMSLMNNGDILRVNFVPLHNQLVTHGFLQNRVSEHDSVSLDQMVYSLSNPYTIILNYLDTKGFTAVGWQSKIHNNFSYMLKNILNPEELINKLCDKSVFKADDTESIVKSRTQRLDRKAMTRHILEILLKSDEETFRKFRECLKELGYKDIFYKLRLS
ncbi:hypothetical protein SNE40_003486 [Patella caerulea]